MWKQLPRDLKLLLFSTILANISSGMYGPFMPLYVVALGGSVERMGLFFTATTLSTAVMRPFGGWFSDSIGRVQAVAVGSIFGLLGTAGYALAPSWVWLVGAGVVLAVGRSIVGPSFQSFIAESAPVGRTAQTFGLVNGIFTSCRLVGPILAGWLVARYGLHSIFFVGTLFTVAATALRVWPAWGRPFIWRDVQLSQFGTGLRALAVGLGAGGLLTWLFITDSLRDMGMQSYENLHTILLAGRGMGEQEIGYIFSFSALVYLLVGLFGTRLVDRWGAVRSLVLSGLLQAAALVLLVSWPIPPIFWLFTAITAVALGLGDPAFDAFLAQSSSAQTLGLTFGLFSGAISILSAPMPYVGSWLWENIWFGTPFLLGAALLGLAGILTWLVLPQKVK